MDTHLSVQVAKELNGLLGRQVHGSNLETPYAYAVEGSVYVRFYPCPSARLTDEETLQYKAWLEAGHYGSIDDWRESSKTEMKKE